MSLGPVDCQSEGHLTGTQVHWIYRELNLAKVTVPTLPKPSSSKSVRCRTLPNREKRRSPLKVLSRAGCVFSRASSYMRVAPPWCRVMVRNAILDTSSETSHRISECHESEAGIPPVPLCPSGMFTARGHTGQCGSRGGLLQRVGRYD